MSIEAIGPESVEGVDTTKFKLVMKDGSAGGFMWFTTNGIPMKMDLLHAFRFHFRCHYSF